MFGPGDQDEKQLRKNGRSARAQIVEVDQLPWTVSAAPDPVASNTELMWKVKLLVTAEGEGSFSAELEGSWPHLEPPHVGQTVQVLFDPDDHTRVAIDHSAEASEEAIASTIESRMGHAQADALKALGLGSVQDIMKAAMADPQGFAAQMQERAAAMQKAAMEQADVLRAQAAQAQAAAAGTAPAEDPVDRLVKLADLHDRGVLTDEEFTEQKKRILGG